MPLGHNTEHQSNNGREYKEPKKNRPSQFYLKRIGLPNSTVGWIAPIVPWDGWHRFYIGMDSTDTTLEWMAPILPWDEYSIDTTMDGYSIDTNLEWIAPSLPWDG